MFKCVVCEKELTDDTPNMCSACGKLLCSSCAAWEFALDFPIPADEGSARVCISCRIRYLYSRLMSLETGGNCPQEVHSYYAKATVRTIADLINEVLAQRAAEQ